MGLDLIRTFRPGRGPLLQADAQLDNARHLATTFLSEPDAIGVAALAGDLVGTVTGAF